MPFFEPLPPLPEPQEQPTGWRPPLWDRPSEAMLGAPTGIGALLAKTDRLAVAISNVMAYPNGFTFDLVIQGNPTTPRDPMTHAHPMMGGPRTRRGPRVGFEFADGSRASEGGPMPVPGRMMMMRAQRDPAGIPTAPLLTSRGGGGGSDQYSMRFWCFPLPPPGPMHVYLEWGDMDIDETEITLDATGIVDAAANAVTLWEPDDEQTP
jgi:hypothetical protein